MAKKHSSASTPKGKTPEDWAQFYDHFAEFHDHCAFLCEAMACIAGEDTALDKPTASGIIRYCYWLKDQADALKVEMKLLR